LYFLTQGLAGRHPRVVETAVVWELIHTASLIHDDVVDDAKIRRGEDSLNGMHDNRVSVLVGDSLWAAALEHALDVPFDGFMSLVSRTASAMARGELTSTLASGNMISQNEYLGFVADKTASLFEGVCVSGGMAASADEITSTRLRDFGRAFGMGFQFHDDITDLTGEVKGKPPGLDARGGRATLPLILAWERADADERDRILDAMPNGKPWDSVRLRSWSEGKGGIETAKRMMETELSHAADILNRFPDSKFRGELQELIKIT
jgi:octaprenyl-diphosphate synthase